jgi:hypothetical protein
LASRTSIPTGLDTLEGRQEMELKFVQAELLDTEFCNRHNQKSAYFVTHTQHMRCLEA